jgi:hypothetical protein
MLEEEIVTRLEGFRRDVLRHFLVDEDPGQRSISPLAALGGAYWQA